MLSRRGFLGGILAVAACRRAPVLSIAPPRCEANKIVYAFLPRERAVADGCAMVSGGAAVSSVRGVLDATRCLSGLPIVVADRLGTGIRAARDALVIRPTARFAGHTLRRPDIGLGRDVSDAQVAGAFGVARGWKKLAVLHPPAMRGVADVFRTALRLHHLKPMPRLGYRNVGELRQILHFVLDRRMVDAIFMPASLEDAAIAMSVADMIGWPGAFIGTSRWNATHVTTTRDVYLTDVFTADEPGNEDFVSAFREVHGADPTALHALGHDAATLALASVVDPDLARGRDAKRPDYLTGPFAIDARGFAHRTSLPVLQWHDTGARFVERVSWRP